MLGDRKLMVERISLAFTQSLLKLQPQPQPPDSSDSICFLSCVQKSLPFAIVVAILLLVHAHITILQVEVIRFAPHAGLPDVDELGLSEVGA